jgi:hypothetical protein
MQPETYEAITKALAPLGLVGQMQNENQLIVSSQQGPVWPNRGNSFWLSRQQGVWYLSTWLPAGYRIPADQDLVALCVACMGGPSAMYRAPPAIIERFRLQVLNQQEYGRLFSRGSHRPEAPE